MNIFVAFIFCLITAKTSSKPSYSGHHETHPLEGVPDIDNFSHLSYPKYDILELGEYTKGSIPPAIVQINKKVVVTVPKPYPVKVPVHIPQPYPVAKPYPVIETKVVKVPHPVPFEVVKTVSVPIEVPKPYPVPTEEFKAPQYDAPNASYGQFSGSGSYLGHQGTGIQTDYSSYGSGGDFGHQGSSLGGGYGGGFSQESGGYGQFSGGEHYGAADQSGSYSSMTDSQQGGWKGLDASSVNQQEEQH